MTLSSTVQSRARVGSAICHDCHGNGCRWCGGRGERPVRAWDCECHACGWHDDDLDDGVDACPACGCDDSDSEDETGLRPVDASDSVDDFLEDYRDEA